MILVAAPVNRLSSVLIHLRDAVLDRTLGRPMYAAGNPHASAAATHIAAELRTLMNRLQARAISADGAHVDYHAVRRSDDYAYYRAHLLPQLATFDPTLLQTRAEQLAFWINLYHAVVIDAVISTGVKRSVSEGRLGGLAFFRRAGCAVSGCCLSCDDIEHGILRANRGHPIIPGPQFASDDPRRAWVIEPLDPRIHFALNCASRSCPPIGVYDAIRVDEQLALAARSFVDQTTRCVGGGLEVSPLFRWYAGDFGGLAGVLRFLADHLPDDERRAAIAARADVPLLCYAKYDWGLNV